MYRIELTPGEETVFRTLEELAIGVRNGLVTPRSRIYHNASEKWLPIEFHPHYKKALQLPIGRPSEPSPRGNDKPSMATLSFAVPQAAPKKTIEAVTVASESVPPESVPPESVRAESVRAESIQAESVLPKGAPAGSAQPTDRPSTGVSVEQPRHDYATPAAATEPTAAAQVEPTITIDHDFNFETHDRTPEQTPDRTPARSGPRPDSYLPASARLVADDPHAVTAPMASTMPTAVTIPTAVKVPAAVTVPWASPPVVEAPSSTGAASLPPEPFELPTISYPEITPAEAPVVERGGPSRGRRSLQIVVAMVVLATGGYLAKSFYSPVGRTGDRSLSVQADRPALPPTAQPPIAPAASKTPVEAPAVPAQARAVAGNRSPLSAAPAAPASSGFAAALEPRAQATGPAPALPRTAVAPAAAAATDSSVGVASLAPPPLPAPLELPVLTEGVPQLTAPTARNDSAMKRILRAVSGGKDAKQP